MSSSLSVFEDLEGFDIPPIDSWYPDKTVDFDIKIDRQGNWYHEGELIKRQRLVKLFASVLRREQDGCYYLVTPAVKYRIKVEDVPLIMVQMHVAYPNSEQQVVYFRTHLDDEIQLNAQHKIVMADYKDDQGSLIRLPYVYVRQGFSARLSRNVFYELIDYLQDESQDESHGKFSILSAGEKFYLSV